MSWKRRWAFRAEKKESQPQKSQPFFRNLHELDTPVQWEVKGPHFGRSWDQSQLCETLVIRLRCKLKDQKYLLQYRAAMNIGTLQAAACNPTPSNIITLPNNKAARRPYKSEAKGVKGRAVKLPRNCAEVRRPDYWRLNIKHRRHCQLYCLPNLHPWGWPK